MEKIKIGIFDDHPIVIKALTVLLASNKTLELVFTSECKSDFLNKILFLDVDVVIVDIVASDVLGIELFEETIKKRPNIKCIAHSSLTSAMLVENLLSIGVKGFVNKKQPEQDIITAIQTVYDNEISIPKEYHFLTSKYHASKHSNLTAREIEIIVLISQEFTSTEIAEKLSISPFTVENHRKTIFKKLEVKNLAGMILIASRLGYIS